LGWSDAGQGSGRGGEACLMPEPNPLLCVTTDEVEGVLSHSSHYRFIETGDVAEEDLYAALRQTKIVEHPQVKARGMLVACGHPVVGKVQIVGVPIKLSETPSSVWKPAPPARATYRISESLLSSERLEQRLGLLEVGSVKTFGEPAVDFR
jgi:CoA-transferase family III